MIERDNKIVYLHGSVLKDAKEAMGDDFTAEDLLEYLIESSDYSLRAYSDKGGRTIFNRVNMLWVWPLFMLSIPFQWIISGKTGYKLESKMGRILEYLVKID